jgi:hypothetical protein
LTVGFHFQFSTFNFHLSCLLCAPKQKAVLQESLSKYASPAEKQGYLLELTAKYPYFAPARLALLQSLEPGTEAYNRQAAIAQLLYNNAHWLHFSLHRPHAEVREPAADDRPGDGFRETGPDHRMGDEGAAAPAVPATDELLPQTDGQPQADAAKDAAIEVAVPAPHNEGQGDATGPEDPGQPQDPATPPAPMPGPPTDGPLLFEPLHAVDYFASQGIKLTEEPQPGDRLGHQLKSFTEWLKTLKKLPQPASGGDDATPAEAAVQTSAEQSNADDEVVTEAMAEVLALQGKPQKAIAIYRKLSLLNPHKSAYFAAKIENLR